MKHVESFDEMTNISKKFIQVLKDNAILISLKKEEVQVSKLDGTRKYLFALDDGNVIESVLMKYKHGNSVCISSQVGCRMGCRFCASTLDGLVRGLRPSEMIDQIYQIGKDIGERISNVVVMGTGEPLDNYDNLLRFIELLTDENGINISQRNLTVSTCGLVPRMRQLADEKLLSRWRFHCMPPTRKREKLSCRLQTAMIYMMWSMHANIILHRPAAESPLSIAW